MMKQTTNKMIQSGFTPLPNAQTRVWGRLQAGRAGNSRTPAVRWALAACAAAAIVCCAALWMPREAEPMLAGLTSYDVPNQRYGEAGPRGQEYALDYIPFQ